MQINENVGQVSILVNNAGIVTGKKFLESSDKAIDLTFKVNTMAHFWVNFKHHFILIAKKS